MNCLYVLELEGGKYYVGRTSNIISRFNAHVHNFGSIWTKLYGVKSIIKLTNDFPFGETAITLEYMQKYGIDNVRGSCWCKEILSEDEKTQIQKFFRSEIFARKNENENEEKNEEERSYKIWTEEEEYKLIEELHQKILMEDIAKIHERTVGAIIARIKKCILQLQGEKTPQEIASILNLKEVCVHGVCRLRNSADIQYA